MAKRTARQVAKEAKSEIEQALVGQQIEFVKPKPRIRLYHASFSTTVFAEDGTPMAKVKEAVLADIRKRVDLSPSDWVKDCGVTVADYRSE